MKWHKWECGCIPLENNGNDYKTAPRVIRLGRIQIESQNFYIQNTFVIIRY